MNRRIVRPRRKMDDTIKVDVKIIILWSYLDRTGSIWIPVASLATTAKTLWML